MPPAMWSSLQNTLRNIAEVEKILLTNLRPVNIIEHALARDSVFSKGKKHRIDSIQIADSSSDILGEILKRLKRRPC